MEKESYLCGVIVKYNTKTIADMLTIDNISYGYQTGKNVLENFSLTFSEPGVYGLLGKNGTGKSTLLYLIMGLLCPAQGKVQWNGIDTIERNPEALQEMFIVPEEYNLPQIKLRDYVRALKPFYPDFDEVLLDELLAMFDMPADINLGALSMGQKKKVYMCVALAARTRLLVMDEPTNGLDILAKKQFRKVIAQGTREDQIVIISTHQVKDVELLLDHVTIINNNKVLLNERINVEAPVDLEELFVSTLLKEEVKA